jgi:hypothetical protein
MKFKLKYIAIKREEKREERREERREKREEIDKTEEDLHLCSLASFSPSKSPFFLHKSPLELSDPDLGRRNDGITKIPPESGFKIEFREFWNSRVRVELLGCRSDLIVGFSIFGFFEILEFPTMEHGSDSHSAGRTPVLISSFCSVSCSLALFSLRSCSNLLYLS